MAFNTSDKLNNKRYLISIDLGLGGYISYIKLDSLEENKEVINCKILNTQNIKTEDKTKYIYVKDETKIKKKTKPAITNNVDYLENLNQIKNTMELFKIRNDEAIILVEQLTSRPGHSATSAMSMGDTFATFRAIANCLNIDFLVIPPKTWKTDLGLTKEKQESIELLNFLISGNQITFENDLIAKTLSKKRLNHNLVESILIGIWYHNKSDNFLKLKSLIEKKAIDIKEDKGV